MTHPELEAEQSYVDGAYAHLERMRGTVARAADAADGEVAQAALDAWAAKRLRTFEDAERGLVFGRLDLEAAERPLYVGRAGCTTRRSGRSWSTGRRRRRGRSTPRRRRTRTA